MTTSCKPYPSDVNDDAWAFVSSYLVVMTENLPSKLGAVVDQGNTGEQAAVDAARHGVALEVVELPEAKRDFVVLPVCWVEERSLAWMAKFRRFARAYKHMPTTVAVLRVVTLAGSMLHCTVPMLMQRA